MPKNSDGAMIYPDLILAHATSTKLGDVGEAQAIRLAFGEYASKIPIYAPKSHVGHALGGIGAVPITMMLERELIPANTSTENLDPAFTDLDVILGKPRECNPKMVLSNGFGFGGFNCSISFGPYRED